MRMRRTEDKLPAVPAAGAADGLICISDFCMRMRRIEDKLPAVPAAGTADEIWNF